MRFDYKSDYIAHILCATRQLLFFVYKNIAYILGQKSSFKIIVLRLFYFYYDVYIFPIKNIPARLQKNDCIFILGRILLVFKINKLTTIHFYTLSLTLSCLPRLTRTLTPRRRLLVLSMIASMLSSISY